MRLEHAIGALALGLFVGTGLVMIAWSASEETNVKRGFMFSRGQPYQIVPAKITKAD